MNRDHKVFSLTIQFDQQLDVVDAMGDRVGAGPISRTERVVTVVTSDVVYAKAWLVENPHRFPNVKIMNMVEAQVDAVIELHTY